MTHRTRDTLGHPLPTASLAERRTDTTALPRGHGARNAVPNAVSTASVESLRSALDAFAPGFEIERDQRAEQVRAGLDNRR
jgi:hypothetical protein